MRCTYISKQTLIYIKIDALNFVGFPLKEYVVPLSKTSDSFWFELYFYQIFKWLYSFVSQVHFLGISFSIFLPWSDVCLFFLRCCRKIDTVIFACIVLICVFLLGSWDYWCRQTTNDVCWVMLFCFSGLISPSFDLLDGIIYSFCF